MNSELIILRKWRKRAVVDHHANFCVLFVSTLDKHWERADNFLKHKNSIVTETTPWLIFTPVVCIKCRYAPTNIRVRELQKYLYNELCEFFFINLSLPKGSILSS